MHAHRIAITAFALAVTLVCHQASADHIFTLSNVSFNDPYGGAASGFFVTNDALTAVLIYDITTTAGTGPDAFSGFEYSNAVPLSSPSTRYPVLSRWKITQALVRCSLPSTADSR